MHRGQLRNHGHRNAQSQDVTVQLIRDFLDRNYPIQHVGYEIREFQLKKRQTDDYCLLTGRSMSILLGHTSYMKPSSNLFSQHCSSQSYQKQTRFSQLCLRLVSLPKSPGTSS